MMVSDSVPVQREVKKESSVKSPLPPFSPMSSPEISLLNGDAMKITKTIDHKYEEICWKKCEGVQHNFSIMDPGYLPPEVKTVFFDWGKMNPQPSEVSLHSLLQAKDPEYPASVERSEVIDPKITGFSIPRISQDQSYALEFTWGKGKAAYGRSVVSFSLK